MKNSIFGLLMVLTMAAGYHPLTLAQGNNLDGVWYPAAGRGQPHPQSEWSPDELPFTPAGRAAFDGNLPSGGETRRLAAHNNDPLSNANPPGIYRSFVYGRPWQFIQLPDRVVQLFEWTNHWRTIWTDGREVPEEVVTGPFWYGYAVGRWEGDTLIVQTVDLDGRAWLDGNGTPLSEFGGKVEERWKLVDADTLELSITVDDPEYYTRPWTSEIKTFELQARDSEYGELGEVIFAPIDEEEFNRTIVDPSAEGPKPLE
jgi:hypothetical protein